MDRIRQRHVGVSDPMYKVAAMTLRLGLIGDTIAQSSSPDLHRQAGKLHNTAVTYDLLVPQRLGRSFLQILEDCARGGYRGVNVTYPYKGVAAEHARVDEPNLRRIGAVNTIVFNKGGLTGYNTDHSGFIAAYRRAMGDADTGPVLMIGSGGVGRAVAFGLARLGTKELRVMDHDVDKSEALAEALKIAVPGMKVTIWTDAEAAARGASGLINCSPVGMIGHSGTPLQSDAMQGANWAFDAVYTPVNTTFLLNAKARGLATISGWELFFFQGLQAWEIFSNLPCDETSLRRNISNIG